LLFYYITFCMISVFLLHRDFGLADNIGFIKCLENSKKVYIIFIFTPEQAEPKKNKYFSSNSFNFMIESLRELNSNKNIKVSFFRGNNIDILKHIFKYTQATALWANRDFTPYAKQREKTISQLCKDMKIQYNLMNSITLFPMGKLLTAKLSPYKIYTPFYKNAVKHTPSKPTSKNIITLHKKKINQKKIPRELTLEKAAAVGRTRAPSRIREIAQLPGRDHALKILNNIKNGNFSDYSQTRDIPSLSSTTYISAHLHYGNISPREFYWAVVESNAGAEKPSTAAATRKLLIQQLFWREFYMYVVNYIHTDYKKKSDTIPKFNKIKWNSIDNSTTKKHFEKWKEGNTGIPIVDAGMRELKHTGYLHNRLRMITAMFLIHYLGIHWKYGEQWFAQSLVDYSYSNNYGGWVWCAGTEIHSNIYFRVFSMTSQTKRFDPECKYIFKWIPELKSANPRDIWNWDTRHTKYPDINYPTPIIRDLQKARKDSFKRFPK
jgi:deoxyribodipyrimidine photo-lyase